MGKGRRKEGRRLQEDKQVRQEPSRQLQIGSVPAGPLSSARPPPMKEVIQRSKLFLFVCDYGEAGQATDRQDTLTPPYMVAARMTNTDNTTQHQQLAESVARKTTPEPPTRVLLRPVCVCVCIRVMICQGPHRQYITLAYGIGSIVLLEAIRSFAATAVTCHPSTNQNE